MSNSDPETSRPKCGWHQIMTECRRSWQAGADGAALPLVSQFPSQHPLLGQAWANASKMPGGPFPQPLKKGAGPQTIQWKPGTTASWQWLVCLRTLHSCRSEGVLPFLKHLLGLLWAQQDLAPHILFKFMVFGYTVLPGWTLHLLTASPQIFLTLVNSYPPNALSPRKLSYPCYPSTISLPGSAWPYGAVCVYVCVCSSVLPRLGAHQVQGWN